MPTSACRFTLSGSILGGSFFVRSGSLPSVDKSQLRDSGMIVVTADGPNLKPDGPESYHKRRLPVPRSNRILKERFMMLDRRLKV